MYRRYSDVNQSTVSRPQMRRNRIKNILILVLLAAVITLAVVARPALESRSGARALMIQRMQTEIAEAVRLATSLSRNAGADSASLLARIRSNIYAIRVCNDLSIGQEGAAGRLIPEERLTTIQSAIDNYLGFLTTGMDTGEQQTNLMNNLQELELFINDLR